MENGIYRGRAVSAMLGETATGKEQVAIQFEFLEMNEQLTYYGYFTDAAREHAFKALRAAGWTGDDLSDLSGVGGPDAPEVSLVVENEEYQGHVYPKIRWVNVPGGGPAVKNPLSADKAKAFAARMKGAVLAFDKSAGTPKAKPVSRTGPLSPEPPPNMDEPPV